MDLLERLEALGIVAVLLSIAAAVLAFIFILPEKRRPTLNGFGKFLHDLCNFRFLIIEKILVFCYIFLTTLIILVGFFALFYEAPFISCLLIMVVGPIAIRLVYEFAMMTILLIKNVIQINNKLKNQNEGNNDTSPFAAPVVTDYSTPANNATAVPTFCSNCGAAIGPDGVCHNCNHQ